MFIINKSIFFSFKLVIVISFFYGDIFSIEKINNYKMQFKILFIIIKNIYMYISYI